MRDCNAVVHKTGPAEGCPHEYALARVRELAAHERQVRSRERDRVLRVERPEDQEIDPTGFSDGVI